MMEEFPDDPKFYEVPVSEPVQAAIGRLVITWAAAEASLPRQVARLIATDFDRQSNEWLFCHPAFIRSATVVGGTDAKAALAQIVNLSAMIDNSDTIKKAADKLRNCKSRRDEICHWVISPTKTHHFDIKYLAASRAKMFNSKTYNVAKIDSWCVDIKKSCRAIDAVISNVTGWNWTRIQESQEQWLVTHEGLGA